MQMSIRALEALEAQEAEGADARPIKEYFSIVFK